MEEAGREEYFLKWRDYFHCFLFFGAGKNHLAGWCHREQVAPLAWSPPSGRWRCLLPTFYTRPRKNQPPALDLYLFTRNKTCNFKEPPDQKDQLACKNQTSNHSIGKSLFKVDTSSSSL